jgi:dTDP-glucose 4,6-dehydratase
MKVLVTGGAGFIGSNFAHYWLKNHPDDDILNVDKLTYAANPDTLKDVEGNPHYSFKQADITDSTAINLVMQGIDIVVNFAAETHVDRSILDPSVFVKTNVLGTQTLLEAALKNNVKRFHHISTDEVFGALELDSKEKFDENTPYAPRSPYSASKAASDHLVRAYNITFGLPITISNCSNNFGPYMFPEKLIPLAITNIMENKKVPIYGDGLNVRDWLFVEDHCTAIESILEKGKAGETYLVGGLKDAISNLDLIKRILQIMGKGEDQIEFVKDRPGHDRRYDIDFSKIKRELGWEPKYSLDQALENTVTWYKEHEDWWKPLKKRVLEKYY